MNYKCCRCHQPITDNPVIGENGRVYLPRKPCTVLRRRRIRPICKACYKKEITRIIKFAEELPR